MVIRASLGRATAFALLALVACTPPRQGSPCEPDSPGWVWLAEVDDLATSLQRGGVIVPPAAPPPAARASYEHAQEEPALSWTVQHGLGVFPAFVVVNAGRFTVQPLSVQHTSRDTAILTFDSPTAGTVRAF